jgi:hypothetical protein
VPRTRRGGHGHDRQGARGLGVDQPARQVAVHPRAEPRHLEEQRHADCGEVSGSTLSSGKASTNTGMSSAAPLIPLNIAGDATTTQTGSMNQ